MAIDREPTDRLTRMCEAMTEVFDSHPEHREGDKCIVFLDDGKRGGIECHGYEDDTEPMVDLLMHLKAIFRANGKRMDIMFMDENGVIRD
jgi:hypothetical protein